MSCGWQYEAAHMALALNYASVFGVDDARRAIGQVRSVYPVDILERE